MSRQFLEMVIEVLFVVGVPLFITTCLLCIWVCLCRAADKRRVHDVVVTVLFAIGIVVAPAVGIACYWYEWPRPPTKYADDYTLYRFNQVQLWDTEEEVLKLLGPPLSTPSAIEHALYYSWPARGNPFQTHFKRVIWLDPDSRKVDRIVSELYIW